jgi:hypothetical protein
VRRSNSFPRTNLRQPEPGWVDKKLSLPLACDCEFGKGNGAWLKFFNSFLVARWYASHPPQDELAGW